MYNTEVDYTSAHDKTWKLTKKLVKARGQIQAQKPKEGGTIVSQYDNEYMYHSIGQYMYRQGKRQDAFYNSATLLYVNIFISRNAVIQF